MSRLVWLFGWACVAVWSLVCLLAYGFVDLLGGFLTRNADAFASDPQTVESLWRFLSGLHSFSTGTVGVVWAIVSLLILSVPWAIDRMTGPVVRASRPSGAAVQAGITPSRHPAAGEVIDLDPGQYSVRPATSAPSGSPLPRG